MDPDGKWTSTRAVLLAAAGQNRWPPAGTYMATTGQDLMAADRLLAVETVWWADGLTNIHHYSADGYAAEGHAVILSTEGLRDVEDAFGPMTAHLSVTRGSYEDPDNSGRASALRAIPL